MVPCHILRRIKRGFEKKETTAQVTSINSATCSCYYLLRKGTPNPSPPSLSPSLLPYLVQHPLYRHHLLHTHGK